MSGLFEQTGVLPLCAAAILAVATLVYVLLDGTDLGVGILFFVQRDPLRRELMIDTILPVWDGNETWLVLGGGGLIAMFPLAYAVLLSALYPVVFAMLLALILRGVAIEFRDEAAKPRRPWWDLAALAGSALAAFSQGALLGALVQGIHIVHGAYAGALWDWLTPFSLFCGAGLMVGYGWLGACWLIWRTEESLQQQARRWASVLAAPVFAWTAGVIGWSFASDGAYAQRWLAPPAAWPLWVFGGMFGVLACAFAMTVRRRHFAPLLTALAWFCVSFVGVLFTLFPLIVPPSLTIAAAAAPPSTQAFTVIGSAVLIPAILIYSSFAFWAFRGKVRAAERR